MTSDGQGEGSIELTVDGQAVRVPDDGATLLDVLREQLDVRSPKDGCSPQGQCGCCTVLVEGQPRVSCVTPVRRVRGRSITTVAGLEPEVRQQWADAFHASGGSQCGFCTPGIICRLEGLRAKGVAPDDRSAIDRGLAAHLCRCTGWQTIREAYAGFGTSSSGRDRAAAEHRALLEGGVAQLVAPEVSLGHGGFADDTAPTDALFAVPDPEGGWAVAESLSGARAAAGKVQGRRTTAAAVHPLEIPDGDWDAALRTTWVEPAYLETDASWCVRGGEPASPVANGGAFGGKGVSIAPAAARELANQHGRPVRVLLSREDTVRLGPKRPPLAGGVMADGSGELVVVRTPGVADAVGLVAPAMRVSEVDVPGPPTSAAIRGAGWVEALVLLAGARGSVGPMRSPGGGVAEAEVTADKISIRVDCGRPLDATVVRSYCIGAAHMAYSWVRSESIAVDEDGSPLDLTVRSFGVMRAADFPHVEIEIVASDAEPVNGSDAVFAAVAAATWLRFDCPREWPIG